MTDAKLNPGKFADSNVVSLDAWRDRKQPSAEAATEPYLKGEPVVGTEEFDAIMKRNLENQNRLTKERTKNNEGVKRSYRLKSRPIASVPSRIRPGCNLAYTLVNSGRVKGFPHRAAILKWENSNVGRVNNAKFSDATRRGLAPRHRQRGVGPTSAGTVRQAADADGELSRVDGPHARTPAVSVPAGSHWGGGSRQRLPLLNPSQGLGLGRPLKFVYDTPKSVMTVDRRVTVMLYTYRGHSSCTTIGD